MIEKDFFQPLRCETEYNYLINLIKARGFLIEEGPDYKLFLSDNSHKEDAEYLNTLLQQGDLGYVEQNQVTIFPNSSPDIFEKISGIMYILGILLVLYFSTGVISNIETME